MKPQDGSAQERQNLPSTGFLARARGVFLPQADVAFPMVFVLHRPVAADGLREPGRASLVTVQAGDEISGLAFSLEPFASAADELARSGKEADVPFQINAREVAAFASAVVFFPFSHPFVGNFRAEPGLRELVEGGLVVLEPYQIVAAMAEDDDARFFWQLSASPVTSAPSSWSPTLSRRRWETGSSQSSFLPL